MGGQASEVFILLLLLIAATTIDADVSRVKREENDLSDKVKNALSQMGETVGNALQSAADMAKQILENTGFDPKDLPKDLMQTAANMFQLINTSTFQNMLKDIQSQLGDAFSLESLQDNFNKLLHDPDFVSIIENLLAEHDGNPNDPGFITALELVTETRLKAMGGAAIRQLGLFTLLAGLLGALLAPRFLPWD